MKLLTILLALCVTLPAFASSTWTTPTTKVTTTVGRVSKLVATTDTPAAPTTDAHGLDLAGLHGFTVHVEAASTMTAGGTLDAYSFNVETATWARAPELDIVVTAKQDENYAAFEVLGGIGRIAFVPNGTGGATLDVYIIGVKRKHR